VNVDSKDAATLASANLYTDDAIAAIPPVDLTGYATEQYVDDAIAAIPTVDLTGYATEQYVDDAIAAIPPVDLTQIESDIDDLEVLANANAADIDDLEILANANAADIDDLELEMALKETIVNVDSKDAATLASANLYTDDAVSNVTVDLTGYATEQYVDDAIAAIPSVDLTEIESDIAALDGRVDTLEGLVINVSSHNGNFNASPYKIHLVTGVATVKMPNPGLNKIVTIKKTGSDLVTLEPHNTEKIEGVAANYLLTSTLQSVTLVGNGTDWFII
jgi:hypothetical protein